MNHLIAISIGPVQDFIAAARRTRDLWFGSTLLSDISRAIARSIDSQGGRLIFPDSVSANNVANVILAELRAELNVEPLVVSENAKKAAQSEWLKYADEAKRSAGGLIEQSLWDEQVTDVLEFFAAWVPTTESSYALDRDKLMRLLSGRKSCREFQPAIGHEGVRKSSLDGQRESVLKQLRAGVQAKAQARIRTRQGEQLDVLGIVKRLAGGTKPFPSVSRIAADPWIRGQSHRLNQVIEECEKLHPDILRKLDSDAFPQFAAFPFEGTSVFVDRHHELIEETLEEPARLEPLRSALGLLPVPNPYLAVLVADGDGMGAAIASLTSADQHREFSRALAGFAQGAKEIIQSAEHHGVLVYAGGDDVLAFLPIDRCLECARQLRDDFVSRMSSFGSLTLSVGIALGHFMEDLEDLLEYGRNAEKASKKPDRDGLAVHLYKRGSAPVAVRARWSENPDARLMQYAELIRNGTLPSKLPYDLREMARLYADWREDASIAIQQDLYRLIARKTSRSIQSVRDALDEAIADLDAAGLFNLSKELLIARQFATAIRQSQPRGKTRVDS